MAAQTIANIVKSSLGPLGLDKMMVDNIGVRLYLSSFPYRDLNFE
jgi:chaperonin GroEL (HSP60 family)